MVEYVIAFAGEGRYIGIGMEGGDIMAVAIGSLEIVCFHGGNPCDGGGFVKDGFVLLQALGFEEEKFSFDPAALGEAERPIIIVLYVVCSYHSDPFFDFRVLQIRCGVQTFK